MANHLTPDRIAEIHAVVFDLVAEHGYEAVRIDQIAKAAHTSTATIYRNWGSKSGLVISLFTAEEADAESDFPDTGSLLGDLHRDVDQRAELLPHAVRFLSSISLALSRDEELARAYREDALPLFRRKTDQIIERAVARGDVEADNPALHHLMLLLLAPWAVSNILFAEPMDAERMHEYIDTVIAPLISPATPSRK